MNIELFESMAGVKFVPVHYRGAAPAMNDLRSGSINLMSVSVSLALPAFRAGEVKILGIGSEKRLPQAPDIPTVSESGLPGYQAVTWFGLFGTAGTPPDIIAKLNAEVQKIFGDPEFHKRFLDFGTDVRVDGRTIRRFCRLHRNPTSQMVEGHPRRQYQTGMTGGERAGFQNIHKRSKGGIYAQIDFAVAHRPVCRRCFRSRGTPPRDLIGHSR